jgi:hypothetical protein
MFGLQYIPDQSVNFSIVILPAPNNNPQNCGSASNAPGIQKKKRKEEKSSYKVSS